MGTSANVRTVSDAADAQCASVADGCQLPASYVSHAPTISAPTIFSCTITAAFALFNSTGDAFECLAAHVFSEGTTVKKLNPSASLSEIFVYSAAAASGYPTDALLP